MIGGLFKSASRLALVAVAGVMVGGVSANAADLGGDCCADLEERVAELEATTVRKGNRKVSLQLSGWVHKTIMFWDDGVEKNTYAGVDNINSSTRFRFTGEAKIDPKWSAGYLLEIEAFGDINSSQANQIGTNGQGVALPGAGIAASNSGTTLNVRHSAWWIDNKDMGRIWVGLTDPAAVGIDAINLANTNNAANVKVGLNGGGMFLRTNNGGNSGVAQLRDGLSARTWGGAGGGILGGNNGLMNLSDETRQNVIKYVSPTMMGFIFSASWGEDDFWDVALRYAGEFSGFKLAAGVGYTQVTDASQAHVAGGGGASQHFGGCADLAADPSVRAAAQGKDRDCTSWVVGGSVMHVSTGLFVSGNYSERTDNARKTLLENNTGLAAAGPVPSNLVDPSLISSKDTNWSVRGGIEKNWFGIGNTTVYGEYNQFRMTPIANGGFQTVDSAALSTIASGAGTVITRAAVDVWGLGVVQSIDAAAMDLYVAYRNFSADVQASQNVAGGAYKTDSIKDMQIINVGGIIRF